MVLALPLGVCARLDAFAEAALVELGFSIFCIKNYSKPAKQFLSSLTAAAVLGSEASNSRDLRRLSSW